MRFAILFMILSTGTIVGRWRDVAFVSTKARDEGKLEGVQSGADSEV